MIEHIYGIDYKIPDQPAKSLISGFDLEKKKQKFYRTEIPDFFDDLDFDDEGTPIYTEEQAAFVNAELDRIDLGYWFYNNGKATYITGLHYFYLNYWTLENGERPQYRAADRRYFLFQDYCEKKSYIDGIIRGKKRREGATSQATASLMKDSITIAKAFCGIVSKTGPDAEAVFLDMIMPGYRELPIFLKPRCYDDEAQSKLWFVKKKSRTTKTAKKKGQIHEESRGLGSKIEIRNTKLNSFDSGRKTKMLIDECFGKGTKILCSGFVFKNIEDIRVGDRVIVEGGKELEVARTFSGDDVMYEIEQPRSKNYIVSSRHRLYLEQRCSVKSIQDDGIKIMTPEEYLSLDKYRKRTTYGVRSAGLDFDKKFDQFDPYIVGLWIGDGFSDSATFVINEAEDQEILAYLKEFSDTNGYKLTRGNKNSKCKKVGIYSLSNGKARWKKNDFVLALEKEGIFGSRQKRIPKSIFLCSKDCRLKLLAGIIDTDGHKSNGKNVYEIGMSSLPLIEDITTLCRSLGFSVSNVSYKKSNFDTDVFRITISGNLWEIPCRVKRKSIEKFVPKYKYRRNGISVRKLGIGKYYGIQLKAYNDNDRRLILEDFTISMNCGKFPADVPISTYWPIIRQTLKIGGVRVGFALLPSTANSLTKGGRGMKSLWDASNQFEHKITPSGLYRYFAPAEEGLAPFIDEYGESVIGEPTEEQFQYMKSVYGNGMMDEDALIGDEMLRMGAAKWLDTELAKQTDADSRNEFVRMYPRSERDLFDFDDGANIYDVALVRDQKDYLKSKPPVIRPVRFYRNSEGKADFVDDPNGMWKILKLPEDHERYATTEKHGKVAPGNAHKYAITVDPFKNTIVVGKGSKAGAFIWTKKNPLDPENTGFPIAMFWGRPKLKRLFHEQMLLAAEYYGAELCYESDYDDYIEFLMGERKMGYAKERPKNTIDPNRKVKSKVKEYGIKSGDGFSYGTMISRSVEYVTLYSHHIYFMELLDQLEEYDESERTKFDLAVAFQLGTVVISDPVKPKAGPPPIRTPVVRTFNLRSRGH